MPVTSRYRVEGFTTSVAIKAPVQAVSTTNLTLSGEQTVGGVTVTDGDRVLVKDQSNAVDNGIYVVSTGSWTRAADFDGARDVVTGTLVMTDGVGAATIFYRCSTPDPITIGTSSISFTQASELQNPYPRSAAEIAASVVPSDLEEPYGRITRYGAATGGVDSTTAVDNALAQHNAGGPRAFVPAGEFTVGKINWPGNNLTLAGESSGYAYNSSASPKSILKAKAATSIVLDLVQTGLAEDRTGNHIVDLDIDGNSIAVVGIDVAGSNVLERCRVRRCTTAGVRLSNFTNGTRIVRCGLNQNSGWGLQAEGVSTTTYSVEDTNTSLNTLGGINIEAGVVVNFRNVISESNSGPGLRLYKPNTHTNAFEGFTFDSCWFEDNGSTAPNYVLVIDAGTSSPTSGPQRVTFNQCRFTASVATRKYMNVNVAKWVRFNECQFDNSTASDAITLGSNAQFVGFINSTKATGSSGVTATQIDNAMATGSFCWWYDDGVQRVVGAGSPAAGFLNSWVANGGGFAAPKYWFDRDGNVCIEGSIKSGTPPSTCFTLPAGYRPAAQQAFAVDANGAHGLIYVETDGDVVVNVGSATVTHLNGIRFQRAAA